MRFTVLSLSSLLAASCEESPDAPDGGDDCSDGGGGGGSEGGSWSGSGGGDGGSWGACLDMGDFGDAGACDEVEVPLSEATPPVDADGAWATVLAWSPSRALWSSALHCDDSDSLMFELSAAAEPLVVTRTGTSPGCRPGPDLRFPVSLDLTIGDGDLVATMQGAIDTDDGARLILTCIESTYLTLGPTWHELAQLRMDEELNPGQTFVGYGATMGGTLEQAGFGVEGYGDYEPVDDYYGIRVGLWSGSIE